VVWLLSSVSSHDRSSAWRCRRFDAG